MTAPTCDCGCLVEALARVDLLESRVASLTESVNTAVVTMMPKVEALLSGRRNEEVSAPSDSALSTDPAPSASLLEMAERGDGEGIFRMLSDHTDIGDQQRTENGDSALHVAASRGHLKAVMALLGVGVKTGLRGHGMRTPLHCAAAHGHLRVVQRLLDAGAQVDVKDACGATAVELAMEEGHRSVVDLLLLNGVSPDLRNKNGEYLLVLAAKAEQWSIVELLLERGASATKYGTTQESALRYAAERGHVDTMRLLLTRAASNTDLVKYALGHAQSAAVVWAFVELVPDAVRGDAGRWSLLEAGRNGRLEPLVALLEAREGIDSPNDILLRCEVYEHVAFVKELLQRGADVHVKTYNGDTPLHLASQKGEVECVRALLAAGASTTEKNNNGSTPLYVASVNGKVECVRALLAAGASTTEKNNNGNTPLHMASHYGNVECVRALLAAGVSITEKNNDGNTPLHTTSLYGKVDCVRALLAAGASATETNKEGKTPLEVAASDAVRQLFNVTSEQQ